jgi:hypothetical protein
MDLTARNIFLVRVFVTKSLKILDQPSTHSSIIKMATAAVLFLSFLMTAHAGDVAYSHLNLLSQTGAVALSYGGECAGSAYRSKNISMYPDLYSAAYDNGAIKLYLDEARTELIAIGSYDQRIFPSTVSSNFKGGCVHVPVVQSQCGEIPWYNYPCECQAVTTFDGEDDTILVEMVCNVMVEGYDTLSTATYNVTSL